MEFEERLMVARRDLQNHFDKAIRNIGDEAASLLSSQERKKAIEMKV